MHAPPTAALPGVLPGVLSGVLSAVLAAVLVAVLCLPAAGAAGQSVDAEAERLFHEYYEWRLRDDPEYATRQGRHEYNHQLTSRSAAAEASRATTCETYLKDVDHLLSREPSFSVAGSLLVLRADLFDFLAGFRQAGYLLGVDSELGDPAASLARLGRLAPLQTAAQLEGWLSRLSSLPAQLDELTALMQLGVQRNVTAHRLAVELLPDRLRAWNASAVEESVFFRPLRDAPAAIAEDTRLDLQRRGRDVVRQSVLEPLLQFADFIEQEYLNSTRPDMAASSLGDGFYAACLNKFDAAREPPAEMHRLALDELQHLQQEMAAVAADAGFNGTLAEFEAHLAADDAHFFADPDELRAELTATIEERVAPQLPAPPFGQPKHQLEVVLAEDADIAGGSVEAVQYRGPAADRSRPARLLVSAEARLARFDLLSTALAEALPGRHLRRSHVLEDATLPLFRRSADKLAARGTAPSGWAPHAALADGWAEHAAALAGELPLGEEPLERLGRLRRAARCAARLAVDTGVHELGWGRERAERFLAERAALPPAAAAAELRRIVTSPGRAAACGAGAESLRRLRGRLVGQLGGGEHVHRTFDRIVLDCPGPLAAVERCVQREVEQNSQPPPTPAHRPTKSAAAAATTTATGAMWLAMALLTFDLLNG